MVEPDAGVAGDLVHETEVVVLEDRQIDVEDHADQEVELGEADIASEGGVGDAGGAGVEVAVAGGAGGDAGEAGLGVEQAHHALDCAGLCG